MTKHYFPSLLLSLFVCAACGSDSATGTVTIQLSGEEASRTGWPVTDGADTIEFVDGWAVDFDHVLVGIADVSLRASDGDDAMVVTDPIVVDLHLGEPQAWALDGVPARRWDRVGYRFAPVTSEFREVNEIDDADVQAMIDGGFAFWLEGTATRGAESIDFAWGLPLAIDNDGCLNGLDETDGIVVREGGVTEAQITVHLDHLFFDSLAADEPNMRFDPMAAVAEGGVVTLDSLATQSITDMRDAEGEPIMIEGTPLTYDPGDWVLATNDLEQFLYAAAATMGHFNGEGHCEYEIE